MRRIEVEGRASGYDAARIQRQVAPVVSEQIGRILAQHKNINAVSSNMHLTALLMRRARLVGSAAI